MKLSPLTTLPLLVTLLATTTIAAEPRPNIIFVMADDMGWGETGYRNHPVLKTPNLDAMAAAGLRFDRFYAGCPVCSPTRATVFTGRAHDRTGVLSHGYALRLQEKTIAQALQDAGYVCGHFGKWHLNGLKGPGVPIFDTDPRHPGVFGFDEWVSVSNFFDLNPIMSRQGKFEEFEGDSSEVAMDRAIEFLDRHRGGDKPMFAVIWFGTPHSPFRALSEDKAHFDELDAGSANHYGELVALDRSIGTLRARLREFDIADNTLLVFCSDNGGLPRITPETVGGLRGHKGQVYEGGLRVPGIIEWPAVITSPRVTNYPACTTDLFPTVADLLNLPSDVMIEPVDGTSLKEVLTSEVAERAKPLAFRYRNKGAIVDNRYKVVCENLDNPRRRQFALYDLQADPSESRDVADEHPAIAKRLKRALLEWNDSVDASFAGQDYPAGRVDPPDPEPINWTDAPAYQPYLSKWQDRPEYRSKIRGAKRNAK